MVDGRGWGTRVVGQDHYRDHTTEPVLSPGNTEDADNRPGTWAHDRPPRIAPTVKDQDQDQDQEQKQLSRCFAREWDHLGKTARDRKCAEGHACGGGRERGWEENLQH